MSVQLRPLTYDDLIETPDDGKRREVIGGELVVNPAPSIAHQRVLGNLYDLLRAYTRESGLGEVLFAPVDVRLSHFDVVQPDLVFLSAARGRVPGDEGAITRAPDLVVEVVSPSSQSVDRVRKMTLYARSGIAEYWIADPVQQSLVVYVLHGEEYQAVVPEADGTLGSRQLPGLRVVPSDLFANIG